jgi:hypothetical protein
MAEHGAECGDCRHFKPALHPSGRVNKKHFGQCLYVVQWPKDVPMKYGRPWQPPKDEAAVWVDTNAEDCPCYERSNAAHGCTTETPSHKEK